MNFLLNHPSPSLSLPEVLLGSYLLSLSDALLPQSFQTRDKTSAVI